MIDTYTSIVRFVFISRLVSVRRLSFLHLLLGFFTPSLLA